ncbi:hypothetical protein J6590_013217 [Homalodisca vitripennis]|nr:hypothetical protein J6590_013217 [Homalodisca vitripennis]
MIAFRGDDEGSPVSARFGPSSHISNLSIPSRPRSGGLRHAMPDRPARPKSICRPNQSQLMIVIWARSSHYQLQFIPTRIRNDLAFSARNRAGNNEVPVGHESFIISRLQVRIGQQFTLSSFPSRRLASCDLSRETTGPRPARHRVTVGQLFRTLSQSTITILFVYRRTLNTVMTPPHGTD